jgi:hypothetical protein
MRFIPHRTSLNGRHLPLVPNAKRSAESMGPRVQLLTATSLALLFMANLVLAGPADVVSASAKCSASTCDFVVTVRHDDEGWDHFANAWQVLAPDGSVLATRVLRHPHVGEQPFTRRLRDVQIPPALREVRIRARDSIHGLGGKEVVVGLRNLSESSAARKSGK